MVRIDPKKQFSKKLARWTAIFWFLFLTWLSILLLLVPESGMVAFYFACLATFVMIVMTFCYTSNSKREKELFAALDSLSLELQIGNSKIVKKPTDTDTENEPDTEGTDADEVGEEGDNG